MTAHASNCQPCCLLLTAAFFRAGHVLRLCRKGDSYSVCRRSRYTQHFLTSDAPGRAASLWAAVWSKDQRSGRAEARECGANRETNGKAAQDGLGSLRQVSSVVRKA